MRDALALLPELLLLVGAILGLILGLFVPRRRQWLTRVVAAATLLGALAATSVSFAGAPATAFDGAYTVDVATDTARLVAAAAALLVLCLSVETVQGHPREAEFSTLLLLAAAGSMLLAGASDLLVLVPGYLLASVPLYALVGFAKDAPGTEATLKYYLLGAFLNVVLLFGVTLLYGLSGTTAYAGLRTGLAGAPGAVVVVAVVALLAGLLFKAGGVPSHFWVPDVTEGAPTPVAALVTTVPKVGGLLAVYRVLATALPGAPVDWPLLVGLLAAASMTLGNLAAFAQDSPKRLLAYSTISQVGYLLLAAAAAGRSDLALPALLFYLGGYAVTNLGAFAVVAELPHARSLGDYAGLFARHRWLALTLVVCLLGLVGTPPTAVFVGKLTVFSAAADADLGWLVVVAAVNTVASLFYYLRWLGPMFLQAPRSAVEGEGDDVLARAGQWSRLGAYAAGLSSLALGLASGPVLALLTAPLLG